MRVRLFAPLLGALALLAAACEVSGSPIAARVDGQAISQQVLDESLGADGGSDALSCLLGGSNSLNGAGGKATYSSAVAAQLLTTLVDAKLLSVGAARRGLGDNQIARAVGVEQTSVDVSSAAANCNRPAAALVSDLPPSLRTALQSLADARLRLAANLAGIPLTHDSMVSYAASHFRATELYCVSAIVTSTAPTAQALADAARSGASFSALATAHSLDKTSAARGGALGCALSSAFAPALSAPIVALSTGEVSAPIAFNGAYVILTLTSKTRADDAQVAVLIENGEQSRLSSVLTTLQSRGDVEIDPAYGHWGSIGGAWQVITSSGPAPGLIPNPSAIAPRA